MSMKPLISVIIPAYNQGRFLGDAVRSVLNQTYASLEVIVVDDGSTDDTADVARSFKDRRLCYVYQDNRGLSGARNTGIRQARGTYISYLDSDDLFLPRKLALLLRKIEEEPALGFVAGQAVPINAEGAPVGEVFAKEPPQDPKDLLLNNPFHVGSVLVSMDWQRRVGFFDESLRSYEDWDMWLRLALAGCEMGWVDEPVSLYRFHQEQMTRDGRQMTTATFQVLDKWFEERELPESWRDMHDLAYSMAHLRAASQAYHHRDFKEGQRNLCRAISLNPALAADEAQQLADRFQAWTALPKEADPLQFLEEVYHHLPSELAMLRGRRRAELGRLATQTAFQSYARHDLSLARRVSRRAFLYRPGLIRNRGAVSILIRSHLSFLAERR